MKSKWDFYKLWHAEKKEIIEQTEEANSVMTDEERRIHNEQCHAEFQKILEQVEQSEKYSLRLRIPFRRQLFAHMIKLTMEFAEGSGIDITYETTDKHGFLRLETDQLIIDDLRSDYRKIWQRLIQHADTFWVDPIEKYGDPAVQFTFFYSFHVNIRLIGIWQ